MSDTHSSRTRSEIPIWQPDEEVNSCYLCNKEFTFFFRRHHCRKCGNVVCGDCSNTRTSYEPGTHVVTPSSQIYMESPLVPHRTCDVCVQQLALESSLRDSFMTTATSPVEVPQRSTIKDSSTQRTIDINDDSDQERERCPICNKNLQKQTENEREDHINTCLINAEFSGSPEQFRSNRMLVYYIPFPDPKKVVVSCSDASTSTLQQNTTHHNDEKLIGEDECVICLEDSKPGDKVGRLECLCVFHYKCIKNWFKRKGPGDCPVHAVHQ
ncbi:E3 ubiquitin-protein ligase [Wickerhamomyces ciferrii]|uniref:RING-type E3 ubiquitin transferase n=1 Tax=Wickerhamomyces ciferrii (strain ATCC 14091 / BCRC 22168 / CBS 111 / JCM 3599 / NBRC 0793 / NRRL Y-1031 F-60-10) TaxID=1206466 RepID=K0KUZ9_WICCF|nr:E3 ubiquitin-protein ligase [Wickerhamomyces ciferrii]CCH45249.1 E3 ubiquitin-protein ligase [Wickerhamomyces ciferrii]